MGDICRLESVARLYENQPGLFELLCLSTRQHVRHTDSFKHRPQNGSLQSADKTQKRQIVENRKRKNSLHLLHLRLPPARRRPLEKRVLADDTPKKRPLVLLFYQTHRPFHAVHSRRLERRIRQCACGLHSRKSTNGRLPTSDIQSPSHKTQKHNRLTPSRTY